MGEYVEAPHVHEGVVGWHHHHIGAGVIMHLTEALGHATDIDGTSVIYSQHLADHEDSAAGYEDPCRDDQCAFLPFTPDFDEWIVFPAEEDTDA